MRIAIISDGNPISTAYGKMGKYLSRFLKKKNIEVVNVSTRHTGEPVEYEGIPIYAGMNFYPNNQIAIDRSLETIEPDAVMMIRDLINVNLARFNTGYSLAKYAGKCKRYAWTPVMGEIVYPDTIQATLQSFDHIFPMTDWAKTVLANDGIPYNIMTVVGGGFDPEVFRKREDKRFSEEGVLFGTVALYTSQRKQLYVLLKSLKEYVKNYGPAKLYIHNNIVGIPYDVLGIADILGVRKNLMFPLKNGQADWIPEWGLSEDDMARLYSSFTATLSTSGFEGFNVPFLESLACETPVIGTYSPFYDWTDQIRQVEGLQVSEELADIGYVSDPRRFAEAMHGQNKVDRNRLMDMTWDKQCQKILDVMKGGEK